MTLTSIAENTETPHRLVFADVGAPEWLRQRLSARAPGWGLEVVRFDEVLWPNQVRRRLAPSIETDYLVCIDNDVIVEPGWLDRLVACADETGAGVVAPLYLWSDGTRPPKIHMAGGKLTRTESGDRVVLEEAHQLSNADPASVASTLRRRPCDFAEYHCMLIRGDLARDGSVFDEDIVCVHEHIDTALTAKQRGFEVYLEPESRVNYLAFAPYALDDLPFFRQRWSWQAGQSSIAAFCAKWGVADDERSFGDVRRFLRNHLAQVDPVRPLESMPDDHRRAMSHGELAQTRSELLDVAIARGYRKAAIELLAQVHEVVQALMDGAYRPCGRPFLNHLVGTASVLVRYDFRADIVAAGMLHAAYTHCPPSPAGPKASIDAVCAILGGRGSPLETRVRAYTTRSGAWERVLPSPGDGRRLSVHDAEIVAIAAANEVEMQLSGELRYSGRTDVAKPPLRDLMSTVCRVLGVPGLTDTLVDTRANLPAVPPTLLTNRAGSYRIQGGQRIPATSGAFFLTESTGGAGRAAGAPGR
jgi:hypothetical protein